MDTKLVSSIDAVAGSRLMTIGADALLVDAAKLLSDTRISLVVVCDADGAMVGVITKTDIVQELGRCGESACTIAVADVMSRDVTYCRPTDDLSSVLSMMAKRGFAHVPVIDEHSTNPWASSMRGMRCGRCWRTRSMKRRCCAIT